MADGAISTDFYSAFLAGIIICGLAALAFFLPVLQGNGGVDLLGLLLLVAGIAEIVAGWFRRDRRTGRSAIGAGAVGLLLGIFFLAAPTLDVVPATYLIILWLLLRGGYLLYASMPWEDPEHAWLAVTGFADIGLALVLMLGLPVTALTISLFGPTPEIVANFSLVVAASFLVAGVSLIVMALHEQRDGPPNASPAPPSL